MEFIGLNSLSSSSVSAELSEINRNFVYVFLEVMKGFYWNYFIAS